MKIWELISSRKICLFFFKKVFIKFFIQVLSFRELDLKKSDRVDIDWT
jgi:hypothetical protein